MPRGTFRPASSRDQTVFSMFQPEPSRRPSCCSSLIQALFNCVCEYLGRCGVAEWRQASSPYLGGASSHNHKTAVPDYTSTALMPPACLQAKVQLTFSAI